MHKPIDSFRANQWARSGLCHGLPSQLPFRSSQRMGARYEDAESYAMTPAPMINSNNMRIIPTARALKTKENRRRIPFSSILL